jgi:hypothetical protein
MEKYNGWTNYATWRVNLELFDGDSPADICGEQPEDVWQLEQAMKEHAEFTIDQTVDGFIVAGWARAFLADVNWTEIARHKIDEYSEAA